MSEHTPTCRADEDADVISRRGCHAQIGGNAMELAKSYAAKNFCDSDRTFPPSPILSDICISDLERILRQRSSYQIDNSVATTPKPPSCEFPSMLLHSLGSLTLTSVSGYHSAELRFGSLLTVPSTFNPQLSDVLSQPRRLPLLSAGGLHFVPDSTSTRNGDGQATKPGAKKKTKPRAKARLLQRTGQRLVQRQKAQATLPQRRYQVKHQICSLVTSFST